MTVGENIRRIRQERHLTQRQLGEMVGASEAYIRAYESGRRNPKPSSLEKIAEALAVNPEFSIYPAMPPILDKYPSKD
jgi:transcriptional regulator with XRE-family HTH domain